MIPGAFPSPTGAVTPEEMAELNARAHERWAQKTTQQHASETLGREAEPHEADFLREMGML